MRQIFLMSLTAGFLCLLIFLLRKTLAKSLPKLFLRLIWFLLLVRLAIPVFLPAPVSVLDWLPYEKTPEELLLQSPNIFPDSQNSALTDPQTDPGRDWQRAALFFYIWAAGAGAVLLVFVCADIVVRTKLRRHRVLWDNQDFNELLTAKHGREKVKIYFSPSAAAPVAIGIFHTAVYLPANSESLESAALEAVFARGTAQKRHWDDLQHLIFRALLCVHWFNPLVWIGYFLFTKDSETFREEKAEKLLGEKARDARAALSNAFGAQKSVPFFWGLLGFRAISHLVSADPSAPRRKYAGRSAAVSALVLAVVAICLSTNAFVGHSASWYAAYTSNFSAEETLQFYFESWNSRNTMAMRAVELQPKLFEDKYWVRRVNAVEIKKMTFSQSATDLYKKEASPAYADYQAFGITFAIDLPRHVVTGLNNNSENSFYYRVVKKSESTPWKIAGFGFV